MAVRLPRTIRLDASDTFVFERAAEPGEWAVTGTFRFFATDGAALTGKARQAFRAGFLGVSSFGWSTLVVVAEASEEERVAAVELLGRGLVAWCGAPDQQSARRAAEEEVAFAASLCDHPVGTLLGIHRAPEADGVRESFRTLHRRDRTQPFAAFQIIEVEEEFSPEEVNLAELAGQR